MRIFSDFGDSFDIMYWVIPPSDALARARKTPFFDHGGCRFQLFLRDFWLLWRQLWRHHHRHHRRTAARTRPPNRVIHTHVDNHRRHQQSLTLKRNVIFLLLKTGRNVACGILPDKSSPIHAARFTVNVIWMSSLTIPRARSLYSKIVYRVTHWYSRTYTRAITTPRFP